MGRAFSFYFAIVFAVYPAALMISSYNETHFNSISDKISVVPLLAHRLLDILSVRADVRGHEQPRKATDVDF